MTKPKSAPRALNKIEIPHKMKYVEGEEGVEGGTLKTFPSRVQDTFIATVVILRVSSCFS